MLPNLIDSARKPIMKKKVIKADKAEKEKEKLNGPKKRSQSEIREAMYGKKKEGK
jgi:hypothetical protein